MLKSVKSPVYRISSYRFPVLASNEAAYTSKPRFLIRNICFNYSTDACLNKSRAGEIFTIRLNLFSVPDLLNSTKVTSIIPLYEQKVLFVIT